MEQDSQYPIFTGEQFIPGRTEHRIAEDHLERYRFAQNYVQGRNVLDIACGVGYGAAMLAERAATKVDAVDISENTIRFADASYILPNLCFSVGDILTFSSHAHYDVITCFETIEHVTDWERAISNLSVLLRPGGTLLLSSPNRLITSPKAKTLNDPPRNIFHVREFVVEELVEMLEHHSFRVKPDSIFGQRQQPFIRNRFIRIAYKYLFDTKITTDPRVSPLNGRMPRYIVIVATKI